MQVIELFNMILDSSVVHLFCLWYKFFSLYILCANPPHRLYICFYHMWKHWICFKNYEQLAFVKEGKTYFILYIFLNKWRFTHLLVSDMDRHTCMSVSVFHTPKFDWEKCPTYRWQGSKYRISGSYRIGIFHIGYQISGEISGIRMHIGRS